MNQSIYFFLNGQKYVSDSEITMLELIKYFNYNTSLLIIEYNKLICNQTTWGNIILKEDDKVEVITIVGGG